MPTLFVALRDRLLVCRSDDQRGNDWRVLSTLENHDLECVAASPTRPDRAFVGTFENGLVRAHAPTDGDDVSIEHLGTPFVSDAVMSLTISPHDPDVLYAGTEPSRIYRSTDGGGSWTHLSDVTDLSSSDEWYFPPRPHTHHVRWLEVDPFDPDRLYVGIEAGAFVLSTDGGETWQERPAGSRRDNHTLAVHPDREGRVYTAAGDGYAESGDGGESWHRPQDGLEHTYCWGLAVDPTDPEAVIVSSASGASSAHSVDTAESYVYRTTDGEAWTRLDDRGLATGTGVVRAVFDTTAGGSVYAVNNRGLFRSDDFGDRWERLQLEWKDDYDSQTPRGLVVLE